MEIPGATPVAFTYDACGETVNIRVGLDGTFHVDDGRMCWFGTASSESEAARLADEMCRDKKAHREHLSSASEIDVRWMRRHEKTPEAEVSNV